MCCLYFFRSIKQMKIGAVLFDCDGLMFDTERVAQDMWRNIGKEYGITIPDEVFVAITGVKDTSGLQPYYEKIPHLIDVRNRAKDLRFDLQYWASFYPDKLNKKGLVTLNHYLKEHGIPCCVCSSSSKAYVETLIHTCSKPLYFDSIIGGDMVQRGKPDPEIFLKGAEVLQVKPENCLVLEDSKMGILAANNAEMHSCFIQDTIKPDEEMKKVIEYQRNNLEEVIDLIRRSVA